MASVSFNDSQFGQLSSRKSRKGSITHSTNRTKTLTPPATLKVSNGNNVVPVVTVFGPSPTVTELPRTPYPEKLAFTPSPSASVTPSLSLPMGFWHTLDSPNDFSSVCNEEFVQFPTIEIE